VPGAAVILGAAGRCGRGPGGHIRVETGIRIS